MIRSPSRVQSTRQASAPGFNSARARRTALSDVSPPRPQPGGEGPLRPPAPCSPFVHDKDSGDVLNAYCSISRKHRASTYQERDAKRFLTESIISPLVSNADHEVASAPRFTLVHGPGSAGLSELVTAAISLADQQRSTQDRRASNIVLFSMGPFVRFSSPQRLHIFMDRLLDEAEKQASVLMFVDVGRGLKSHEGLPFLEALQDHIRRRKWAHPLLLVAHCEVPWKLRSDELPLFERAIRIRVPNGDERFEYLVDLLHRCTGEEWRHRLSQDQIVAQTRFFTLNNLREVVFNAARQGANRNGNNSLACRLAGCWTLIGEPGFCDLPIVLSDLHHAIRDLRPETSEKVEEEIDSFEARYKQSQICE